MSYSVVGSESWVVGCGLCMASSGFIDGARLVVGCGGMWVVHGGQWVVGRAWWVVGRR